jgi:hypothetical protein
MVIWPVKGNLGLEALGHALRDRLHGGAAGHADVAAGREQRVCGRCRQAGGALPLGQALGQIGLAGSNIAYFLGDVGCIVQVEVDEGRDLRL